MKSGALEPKTRDTRAQPSHAAFLARWPGVFMLLFLVGGLMLALINPMTFRAPRGQGVWDGGWAAAYQTAFEEALATRDLAVTTWGVLDYALFGEGRPGVLVGEDGWLFTTEEFAAYPDGAAAARRNLDYVLGVQCELAEQGVALVVAVLPAKAEVYEEMLGRYRLPDYVRERYEALRLELLAHGIPAPDLRAALKKAKREAPVYLRTGTHWTPFGAQVAATELARAVKARAPFEGLGETAFITEELGSAPYRGDLMDFLALGGLERSLGPAADELARVETTQQSFGTELFGEVVVPVALVGTSYSAGEAWNFHGALQQALGAEVLNVAEEGRGPFAPMAAYLSSAAFRNAKPDVVIWEIPARYLPVAFEEAEAPSR